MFVGHYAPVFALAAARRSPGLAAGFIAVQLVDIGFFSLSFFGIERWALNPSLAGFMPIDLYYMPWTHSLAGSAAWAAAAAAVTALLAPAGRRAVDALLVALLVLSHWVLDLIVHRHDLPLLHDDGEKLGFGLWDHPAAVVPLELGILFAGFALFMRATRPAAAVGRARRARRRPGGQLVRAADGRPDGVHRPRPRRLPRPRRARRTARPRPRRGVTAAARRQGRPRPAGACIRQAYSTVQNLY